MVDVRLPPQVLVVVGVVQHHVRGRQLKSLVRLRSRATAEEAAAVDLFPETADLLLLDPQLLLLPLKLRTLLLELQLLLGHGLAPLLHAPHDVHEFALLGVDRRLGLLDGVAQVRSACSMAMVVAARRRMDRRACPPARQASGAP
eukprot:CAMPEP_0176059712 /NCGR_PEP_ID=MMETSP0120_2-20121206/29759_1 /TAXON_ID=160619 /ORGANISM="Kryptoperidinium foliaceum, Strain CCMP 1326" /LENGTH=144 /DNA_ID=CAMNT_0017393251 /DNA_START=54 /DNA_END=485 /DNA_ORIENTATION=-